MQPQPRRRKGSELCALAFAGRLSDSLSAGEGLKAERGRMWGRHRKRQVVLDAPKHCLLFLPMLFYLLQLLREEAFCRQSAWQMPQQGQALLCL